MVDINNFTARVTDLLYFGKYPSQIECQALIDEGFTGLWVDLTTPKEIPEKERYVLPSFIKRIECPTKDRTPDAIDERRFLYTITNIVYTLEKTRGEKVYVHCRGHGRSAVYAAVALCIVEDIGPKEALNRVKETHKNRKIMDLHWRKMGAPQTSSQKKFVLNYPYSSYSRPLYDLDDDGYYEVEFC